MSSECTLMLKMEDREWKEVFYIAAAPGFLVRSGSALF